MVLVFIMLPGMALIIIPDPGHGDSISAILLILDGGLDGVTARAGSVLDLVLDMDTEVTVTDTGVVAGGVHHFIIPLVGVDGMEVQDLMDSTETTSMYTTIYM